MNCVAPGGMRTPLTKGFRLPEDADFDLLRPVMIEDRRLRARRGRELHRATSRPTTARYMIGSIVSIDGGLVTYGGGFPKPSSDAERRLSHGAH